MRSISPRSSSSRTIRRRLDGLADTDVVGNQQPHRGLASAPSAAARAGRPAARRRCCRNCGTGRRRCASLSCSASRSSSAAARVPARCGSGSGKLALRHRLPFQRHMQHRLVLLAGAHGPKMQPIASGSRQDDPLPAPCGDDTARLEIGFRAHACVPGLPVPKMSANSANTAGHVSALPGNRTTMKPARCRLCSSDASRGWPIASIKTRA